MYDIEVIFTDSGKQINGDVKAKKHSVTESVHSKTKFSDIDDEDDRLVPHTVLSIIHKKF